MAEVTPLHKSWALPEKSVRKTHNLWRTSMYTNQKVYGGASSIMNTSLTSEPNVNNKITALKR